MLQVKSGQLDQLGLLFERHHRGLYGFFYRLTTDGDGQRVQRVVDRAHRRALGPLTEPRRR